MTYAKNNKIEAADFNNIVGLSTSSTTGELNAIWAKGSGNKGYGQPAIPQVTANNQIKFNDWANVVNKTNTIGFHEGTSITSVTVPQLGDRIDYASAIPTNISTITANRLNAAGQGTTATTFANNATTWSDKLTFAHQVTFANGDAARYFFNSGGQLALNFSSTAGTGINGLMANMAANAGTMVFSSIGTSGDIKISGTLYQGVTKVGGGNPTATVGSANGYYALSTANTALFTQTASGSPSGYLNSSIAVTAKTNGATSGGSGDTGNIITFFTVWDEVPNGLVVSTGTSTSLTVRYPSTTYLANSWGAVTVTGTVTGS